MTDLGQINSQQRNTTLSDSNIIPLNKPEACDPLQAILKEGAQKLLAQAIEAEISSFLASDNEQDGKAAIVRNGDLPERTRQAGVASCNGLSVGVSVFS